MRTELILKQALFAKVGEEPAKVSLPHTWNAQDGQDGGNDYWRGHAVYEIELPKPTASKRQYIEFEGANHIAKVYCNDVLLGEHKGGFSTFRFELTEHMKQDKNILKVDVTNEECDVYPQHADFSFFGGLYRDVKFIEVENAHFDLLKDGTTGVFITPNVAGNTRLDIFPVCAEGYTVKAELLDKNGAVAASGEVEAAPHTVLELKVEKPELWDGLKNPCLYTARVTLVKEDTISDCVETSYGYRGFHVDPERGFYLNGKAYPLHGVSRHQDRLDKGWAISREDHEEDLSYILEVGANTIRLAHYQHAGYFYDLCDRAGLVLWAEIPFISKFREGNDARENTLSQMTELIAQNYNHPAICFWGISNEITIGGESDPLYRNLGELNALSKKLDPSRLTTMAQVSVLPTDSQQVFLTDVQGYNHYMGWYGGEVSENGPWMDTFHAEHPDSPLAISEYGCEAILTWHSEEPRNHDYTEEYQAYYHHEMLKTFSERPYLWATFVWNMFDFAADARDEGGCKGRNNKGLMTYDRKTKKDSFYIYKAYWTDEPMVHICGARFKDRAKGQRDITVYSNCEAVTLFVNGHRAGKKKLEDKACVFKNVKLKDGENTITAKVDGAEDEIILCGVDKANEDYVMPSIGGKAGNWFDEEGNEHKLEFPEGYCSIQDSLGYLLDHPQAGPMLMKMITDMAASMGMSKNVKPLIRMVRSMRVEDIIKMAPGKIPEGLVFKLNEQLTQIKK